MISVNTTEDQFNTDAAHCSLREAVYSADSFTHISPEVPVAPIAPCTAGDKFVDPDVIQVPPGTYRLSITGKSEDYAHTGDLDVWEGLTLQGMPGGPVVIDGNSVDRVFHILSDPVFTVENLTVTGGDPSDPSPIIGAVGGGIGMTSFSNTVIDRSTISGNKSDASGAGVFGGGSITVKNSTISGNTVTTGAGIGGIEGTSSGSIALNHVTVTGNSAGPSAGGTGGIGGAMTTTVHNSIIAGNSGTNPDCSGTVTSSGGNVVGDTTGCIFGSMASDALNMPALLGGLADNGGTTFTHALLAGSPAIDRGVATCLATDQRGVSRPIGASCDSGAYEFEASASPSPTAALPGANPLCSSLRKKLKRAKRHHDKPKIRKLRRKLRRLGC